MADRLQNVHTVGEMETKRQTRAVVFKRNMILLRKRFPHISQYLEKCPSEKSFTAFFDADSNGRPAIQIRCADGRIHPLYGKADHERLIYKIAAANPPEPYDIVFILGIGEGEAGLEATRRYKKKPRIVIIEPYPAVFRLALATHALESLLRYERLILYVGNQADSRSIVDDFERTLPVGRNLLFIHPYRHPPAGKTYHALEHDLIHQIQTVRDMWHTARRFGRQMLMNSIANLPSLLGGTPLRELRNRFRGRPIVCVAAGPSLNRALPLLGNVRQALILVCDSAVGSVLQAGIQPHIVTTADIHPSNIKKLKPHMSRLHNSVLAFGVESNPEVVQTYLGDRRVGMTAYSRLVDWFDQALDLQCRLPTMTSVLHLSVLLAIALGGEPIILVGVDQAYLDGQSHAHGSVYSHIPNKENLIPVKSADGGTVYAPHQLVTDRLILEQIIAHHAVRVINVSLKGALVQGAEVKSLEDVIENELSANHDDIEQQLNAVPWEALPAADAVHSELHKLIDKLKDLKTVCQQQQESITHALAMRKQKSVPDIFETQCQRLRADHLLFQRQYRFIIEVLHDAMLNELQTIIRKEEMTAFASVGGNGGTMAASLEIIDSHYRAIASIADLVIQALHRPESNV